VESLLVPILRIIELIKGQADKGGVIPLTGLTASFVNNPAGLTPKTLFY
jgi:hypothetical protein